LLFSGGMALRFCGLNRYGDTCEMVERNVYVVR